MENLSYRIGGHPLVLVTPNAAITSGILPNFAPFRTPLREEETPLFHLSGQTDLFSLQADYAVQDCFLWNGIRYDVRRNPAGEWAVRMRHEGVTHTLCASRDWKRLSVDFALTDATAYFFLNHFLVAAYGMSTAPLRTLKVHASVIELHGEALLFLGESGTGKSTHSRLWQEHVPGCTLLNDDEPVVRLASDNIPRVYGTPWSGKTPCYRNAEAHITAFVLLRQAPFNRLTLLKGQESFKPLFGSCCMMRTDAENKNHVFNTVADILECTPVYLLECLPNAGAVELTHRLMAARSVSTKGGMTE